jgi:hypothetical protein
MKLVRNAGLLFLLMLGRTGMLGKRSYCVIVYSIAIGLSYSWSRSAKNTLQYSKTTFRPLRITLDAVGGNLAPISGVVKG